MQMLEHKHFENLYARKSYSLHKINLMKVITNRRQVSLKIITFHYLPTVYFTVKVIQAHMIGSLHRVCLYTVVYCSFSVIVVIIRLKQINSIKINFKLYTLYS